MRKLTGLALAISIAGCALLESKSPVQSLSEPEPAYEMNISEDLSSKELSELIWDICMVNASDEGKYLHGEEEYNVNGLIYHIDCFDVLEGAKILRIELKDNSSKASALVLEDYSVDGILTHVDTFRPSESPFEHVVIGEYDNPSDSANRLYERTLRAIASVIGN